MVIFFFIKTQDFAYSALAYIVGFQMRHKQGMEEKFAGVVDL